MVSIHRNPWNATGVATGGTASRDLADRFGDALSIKDFDPAGTIGTAGVDATSAFEAAITALGNGGELHLPPGTYEVDDVEIPAVLNGNASIRIIGAGPRTLISTHSGGSGAMFTCSGDRVDFRRIAFAGSSQTGTAVKFTSEGNDYPSSVKECSFSQWDKAIEIDDSDNVTISGNFFLINATHIKLTEQILNSEISSNYILGGSIGIHLDRVTSQAEGIRIFSNTILPTASGGKGILAQGCLEVSIMMNIIDQVNGTGVGIHLDGDTNSNTSVKIVSNWIDGGVACLKINGNSRNIDGLFNTYNGTTSTIGVDAEDMTRFTFIGERTNTSLTGKSMQFVNSTLGNVSSCHLEGGAIATEDSDCQITWRDNERGPTSRSPLSIYENNRGTAGLKRVLGLTKTANFTISIPAGAAIRDIFVRETAGNAVTGGLKIGTSDGGTQVVTAFAVSGSSFAAVAAADISARLFSATAAQTLYVQAVTAWNSASVDVIVTLDRAIL